MLISEVEGLALPYIGGFVFGDHVGGFVFGCHVGGFVFGDHGPHLSILPSCGSPTPSSLSTDPCGQRAKDSRTATALQPKCSA